MDRETSAFRAARRAKWGLFVAGALNVVLGWYWAVDESLPLAIGSLIFLGIGCWLLILFGVLWERYY